MIQYKIGKNEVKGEVRFYVSRSLESLSGNYDPAYLCKELSCFVRFMDDTLGTRPKLGTYFPNEAAATEALAMYLLGAKLKGYLCSYHDNDTRIFDNFTDVEEDALLIDTVHKVYGKKLSSTKTFIKE